MSRITPPYPHDPWAAWAGECECGACLLLKATEIRWREEQEAERLEREEEERLEGHL
jgi:hypothetical protein